MIKKYITYYSFSCFVFYLDLQKNSTLHFIIFCKPYAMYKEAK